MKSCLLIFWLRAKSKTIKVQEAIKDSIPLDIQREASGITADYLSLAVGPAASEVLERGLSELNQLSDILKTIPGQPLNVKVIGRGHDRIKLSWDPPAHNPEAVEEYVVYKKVEGGEWEEAVRTKKTKVLVKGLKSRTKLEYDGLDNIDSYMLESNRKCEFQVVALNSTVTSVAKEYYFSAAEVSPAAMKAFGICTGVAGSFCLPYVVGKAMEGFDWEDDFELATMSDSKRNFLIGLTIAALPVSIALLPITAPVLAIASIYNIGITED